MCCVSGDKAQRVTGIFIVAQDITLTRRLLQERQLVADQWEIFIQTANAPIIGVDNTGLVVRWNDKAVEITGFTIEEVHGKSLVDCFIPAESREFVQREMGKATACTGTDNFEMSLITKYNSTVDLLLTCTTNRDTTGTMIGVIAIGQDISERKQAEEAKSRLAQELQTFIDTANAPIFGIGLDGLVNQWNNKSALLTGYSADEVIGQSMQVTMIVEEFRSPLTEVLEQALKGKESSNFEVGCYTSSGLRIELLLNVTTKRDVCGAIVGVIGMNASKTCVLALMCASLRACRA